MRNHQMRLDTAKKLTTGLLAGCVVCCLLCLLLPASDAVRMAFGWAAIALAVLGLGCLFLYCRCPYCGAHLFKGLYKMKFCPSCRRDFETGARHKGSGGKRPGR